MSEQGETGMSYGDLQAKNRTGRRIGLRAAGAAAAAAFLIALPTVTPQAASETKEEPEGANVLAPQELATASGSRISSVKEVGRGYAVIQLENGTRAIAPHGSKVRAHENASLRSNPNVKGGRGYATTVGLVPPEPGSTPVRKNPSASIVELRQMAIDHGVIPKDQAAKALAEARREQAQLQQNSEATAEPTGGDFQALSHTRLDGGCTSAENNTGRAYGCYSRHSPDGTYNSDSFGVVHYATGVDKSIWRLRRVYSGARYNGTGQVVRWSPLEHYDSHCQNYEYSAGFKGLSISKSGERCESHGPDVTATRFYSEWVKWIGFLSPGSRSGYGVHHFTRPSGTQSGFEFRIHFYAS